MQSLPYELRALEAALAVMVKILEREVRALEDALAPGQHCHARPALLLYGTRTALHHHTIVYFCTILLGIAGGGKSGGLWDEGVVQG